MKELIELENFLDFKLKNKYKILLVLCVLSTIFYVLIYSSISTIIDDLKFEDSNGIKLKVIVSLMPFFASCIYWLIRFNIIKIFKSNKNVVLFSISCENQKLMERVYDIIENINKLLLSTSLNHKVEIINLNNPAANSFKEFVSHLNKFEKNKPDFVEYLKKVEKKLKRIKCRMAIVGNFKERDNPANYYLNTDAIILNDSHGNHHDIQAKLQSDLIQLLKLELKINSTNENDDIQKASNQIFYSVIYILGLVLMLENKYEDSLKIWEILLENITKSDFKSKKNELIALEANTNLIISRYLFYKGEYKKSMEHRDKYLESFPNQYASLITKSILLVEYDRDYNEALNVINNAGYIVNDLDVTWKYNKLYVLIKLKRYKEGMELLENIISNTANNEADIIDQVLSYNHKKIDLLNFSDDILINIFLYAIFQYHKNNNIAEACHYLELFLTNENSINFGELYHHAKSLESNIENRIGYIKND